MRFKTLLPKDEQYIKTSKKVAQKRCGDACFGDKGDVFYNELRASNLTTLLFSRAIFTLWGFVSTEISGGVKNSTKGKKYPIYKDYTMTSNVKIDEIADAIQRY